MITQVTVRMNDSERIKVQYKNINPNSKNALGCVESLLKMGVTDNLGRYYPYHSISWFNITNKEKNELPNNSSKDDEIKSLKKLVAEFGELSSVIRTGTWSHEYRAMLDFESVDDDYWKLQKRLREIKR